MTDYCTIAEQYARDVVGGDVPASQLLRSSCERYLRFLEREDIDFRPEMARRVCRFLEALPHVKGRWASKREKLKLEPWQVWLVHGIFGFYKDDCRMVTSAYVEVPRKNGKSFLAAGIGLYMFLENRELGAEVYSGATTEAQAYEVFRPMCEMVKAEPAIREHYDVQVRGKSMFIASSGNRCQPLVGKPGDGSSPSCAIVDEYHEHQTDELYATMVTGMGARGGDPEGDEPLMFAITTAGDNLDGPCYHHRDDMAAILRGEVDADNVFAAIYGIDEDDAWDTEEALIKANPNYGVSVNPKFLHTQMEQAKRSASKQGHFVTKHLNRWVGSKVGFINMLYWDRQLKSEDTRGCKAWIGIDLASKRDITAVVALTRKGEEYHVIPKFFCPEDTEIDRWHEHALRGDLELTSGAATDYAYVESYVETLLRDYDVQQIGFDEWQAQYLATRLAGKGAPMIAFPHQVRTFSDPMKEIDAMIHNGSIFHDGNKLMTAMVGNVVVKADAKENIFCTKSRPNDPRCKIDGFVALVMATGLMLREKEVGSLAGFLADPIDMRKTG